MHKMLSYTHRYRSNDVFFFQSVRFGFHGDFSVGLDVISFFHQHCKSKETKNSHDIELNDLKTTIENNIEIRVEKTNLTSEVKCVQCVHTTVLI